MTVSATTPARRFASRESVLNALRGAGMRVSTARRVVVNALFAAQRPLAADEIAAGIDGPPVDIASVYRNLETLEQIGAVRHFHAGHRPGRYALASAGEREYLACESCGGVLDVDRTELNAARELIRERFGFEARFTHFPVVGLCDECAREGESE
jgi:Fur family ferric uptake transcriptional regulator